MEEIIIEKAQEKDWPYIQEKLKNYVLDATGADWRNFFVARLDDKAVAFGRIIDYGDFFELASVGVDYYHRGKDIGKRLAAFLLEEAKRMDPDKLVYGVTHRPGFLAPLGFKEIEDEEAPDAMRHKKLHICKLPPSKIKIMKLFSS
ncbi:MAG: GNAT family N-acetyltransferase [Candidatus Omnitrophica bacterium]|nr:GNAT family N-acetyltransferase [Candidatus Omnitrophota bacterium]